MSSSSQLRLRVILDGVDPFVVETRLIDHNSWDVTRARHKWPNANDAPLTWLGFMAWTAARRTGATDLTWEKFLSECIAVETEGADDEGAGEAVDPTPVGPGPA